jgi:hypothetical protein
MSDQRVSNPYATQSPTDATSPTGAPSPTALGVLPDARLQAAFLTQAFVWMFAGLLVSAVVAWTIQSNDRLLQFAAENLFILLIAQIALVVAISWGINRISATVALGLFFVYAASLGVTIGLIVTAYTGESVATAFLSASAMFGAAAIYGAVTKRSLAGIGGYLFMGLIGLVIAMFLNLFLLHSSQFDLVLSIFGVGLFVGLTAWHVQRIANGDLAAYTGSMEKGAVLGALSLYLDFINIFLFLLRIFGGRR